jgi:hypothetical protein
MIFSKMRDSRLISVRRGSTLLDADHQLLARWAADCAQHVLHLFEQAQPHDDRPRHAIEQVRAWARGEGTMTQSRTAAGHAMGAARTLSGAAREAAYAAGQAAAVAHVAAHELGAAATGQDFAVFQNHGYRGLYNGLTAEMIHKRKKLKKSQHILDHMGTTELAANLFRGTQAEDKLRREGVQGKDAANAVHYEAVFGVRRAIAEVGGTIPEDLRIADSIKKLERAEKKRLTAPKYSKKDDQS